MYHATVRTRVSTERAFDALQSALLSNGFEMTERTPTRIVLRHGLWGCGKHSSPIAGFSRIEASRDGEDLSVAASYGNVSFLSAIGAILILGISAYLYVSFAEVGVPLREGIGEILGLPYHVFLPLACLLFLPIPFVRARGALSTPCRSLERLG